MKKVKYIFIVMLLMLFSVSVKAACNDSELNDLAEKFSAHYVEVKDGKLVYPDGTIEDYDVDYAYVLVLFPYSNKFKLMVTDSLSNVKREVKFDDYWGAFVVGSYIHYDEKQYDFELYGADNSVCGGSLLKKVSYTVPKFNEYSLYEFCKYNTEEDVCKMMSNTDDVSQADFEKIAKATNEKKEFKNMPIQKKAIYYIKKYYLYMLIPILLISIYYVIKIRKYKKEVENQ